MSTSGAHPPYPTPSPPSTRYAPRPTLGARFGELTGLVQGLLALGVVVHLGLLGAALWTVRTTHAWLDAPRRVDPSQAALVDRVGTATAFLPLFVILLTAGPFISWLYRAHRSDRMYPAALKHGSGWAIGGWFVPVLSLWRPVQMVNDVRRGAVGHDPVRGSTLVGLWWAAWLTLLVSSQVGAAIYPTGDEPLRPLIRGIRDAAVADAVTAVLNVAGLVLAVFVVRHVSRLVLAAPVRTG